MYPYFVILGKTVGNYGIMIVIACAVATLTAYLIAKKTNFSMDDAVLICLIGIAGGITGAYVLRPITKLPYVLINWEKLKRIPAEDLLNFIFGEIVFYGAFLGGAIAIFWFCRGFKIPLLKSLDTLAPAVPLGHALGRVGCYFGGCCYGVSVHADHPFAVVYPSISLAAPSGVPLLAVPLIEAVVLVCISAVTFLVLFRSKKTGLAIVTYVMLYALARFIIEFFRGDISRGHLGILSTSQVIALVIFLALPLVLAIHRKLHKSV